MVLGVLAGFSERTPYPSGKRSDEKLVSHLYQARREYRRACESAGKSATATLATNRPGKRQKRSARLWSEELGEFPKISHENFCDERSRSLSH